MVDIKNQKNAADIIRAIIRTPEFLEATKKDIGRVAYIGMALDVAPKIVDNIKRHQGDKYEHNKTDEIRQLELVAAIPGWLSAQQRLDKQRDKMTRQERIRTLEPVIAFNKVLREMIDAEQYTRMSEVIKFIQGALLTARKSRELIEYAGNKAQFALIGMRHEIAAESVLSSMQEVYGVDEASLEQEVNGIDIVVTYRGVALGIDIKSNQDLAEGANNNARRFRRSGDYFAMWSGFTNRDFGDDLLPTMEEIKSRQAYYREILDDEIGYISAGSVAFSA